MDIPEDAVQKDFVIQGIEVSAPLVFDEGHKCTANEAHALNQVMIENVRNNLAPKVKTLVDEGKASTDAVQELVDAYIVDYEFGTRGGGTRTGDPVKREALAIASALVRKKLKQAGKKLSEIDNSDIADLAQQAIERFPVIMEQAKKVVDAKSVEVDLTLDDDDEENAA